MENSLEDPKEVKTEINAVKVVISFVKQTKESYKMKVVEYSGLLKHI